VSLTLFYDGPGASELRQTEQAGGTREAAVAAAAAAAATAAVHTRNVSGSRGASDHAFG
jgi:hypothetical protein